MDVAVIGGGPAGLTAAFQLAKQGIAVEVYEAEAAVGGLAKTIPLWNQRVDLGPHRFFSTDPRVNSLWLEVSAGEYEMVERRTRIFYRDRFFRYPLQPFDVLRNLGYAEAAACLLSYLKEALSPTMEDGSFESWVVHRFGRRLYETFFRAYSEKLWGIPGHELDSKFAFQRIKKLSMTEALRTALFRDRKGAERHAVGRFAYAHGGSGIIYERMAAFVAARGGRIHLESPVKAVITEGQRVVGISLANGCLRRCREVVSTMPIDLLLENLPEVPGDVRHLSGKIRFRSTILVYLNIDRSDLFPDNWLYIHSPRLSMGRISNFRNWVPHLRENEASTILGVEYWSDGRSGLWAFPDASLADLAEREVRETGLIGDARILDSRVYRLPRSYPVYDRGYRGWMAGIEAYLAGIAGLYAIGRGGAFKYNNQDHSILMGILAAENIAGTGRHDLWSVNTDYEYHERALITREGLRFA